MKMLVVYESEYGNTETLARATGKALSEHGEVRVAPIEEVAGLGSTRAGPRRRGPRIQGGVP